MIGIDAGSRNDWQKAYDAFAAAWKLKETASIAYNLGRAEVELGKFADAALHLQISIDRSDPTKGNTADAREWLEVARKKAAKLSVVVDLAGARVLLDGGFAGRAPLAEPLLVDPGPHVVEVRFGEERVRRELTAEIGATLTVDVHMPTPAIVEGTQGSSSASTFFTQRNILLLSGLGATVAGLAVGGVAGVQALRQRAFDRSYCPQFRDNIGKPCYLAREGNRLTLSWVSFGGFLGAGMFAAATAVYLGLSQGAEAPAPTSALTVAPFASPTGAGLTVTGAW